MTPMLVTAAICAVLYLPVAGGTPGGAVRSAVKTLAVALLAAQAWAGHAPVLLVLALAACAVGDFLLSRPGDRAFAFGVTFFAVGHIMYAALFFLQPGSDPQILTQVPYVFAVAGLGVLGTVMAFVLAPRAGVLKGPVLTYIPIILLMGISALTLAQQENGFLLVAAAAAFITSDVVLAFENFVLGPGHRIARITPWLVWPLYWGAQVGFYAAFAA